MQEFIVFIIVIVAAIFAIRHLKGILTKGEEGHQCPKCTLYQAANRNKGKLRF